MALPEKIRTERVLLRPYRQTDTDDVFAYASDPEWARYLPVPQPYLHQHAIEFIERHREPNWVENPMWAIEYKQVCIGGINIRIDLLNECAEMGYSIGRQHWGRGLVSEVAQTILDLAFAHLTDLNRVRAMADQRNVGSLRVMEKIGMTREGCLRQNRKWRGEYIDEVWCGILRPEWEARRRP